MVLTLLDFEEDRRYLNNYALVTDPQDIGDVLNALENAPQFAWDLETTGLNHLKDKIHGHALATADREWYIAGPAMLALHDRIRPLAEEKIIFGHNVKFDTHFLNRVGVFPKTLYDTMVMQALLDENQGLGLKSLVQVKLLRKEVDLPSFRELQRSATKSQKMKKPIPIEQMSLNLVGPYAARDGRFIYDLGMLSLEELKKIGLLDVFLDIEVPFIHILLHMEQAGFYIDLEKLEKLEQLFQIRFNESLEIWNRESDNANPESPQQVARFLFTKLGLPSFDTTSTGQPKTDVMALNRIKQYDETGAVIALLNIRNYNKLLKTYITTFLNSIIDGRLHGTFNQSRGEGDDGSDQGTVTWRLASRSPNLQNIPVKTEEGKMIRSAIAAPEGSALIVCVDENTKITTTRGLTPIKEVTIDDHVYMEDGGVQPVDSIIDNGLRPAFKITTEMGYELVATESHRLRIIDQNGEYVWRYVKRITSGDHIVLQSKQSTSLDYVALPPTPQIKHFNQKRLRTPEFANEDLGFFMGYLTGDGSFASRSIHFVVNQNDPEIFDKMNNIALSVFGLPSIGTSRYRGVIGGKFNSKTLVEWLKQIGGSNKQVPNYIWQSPISVIESFLRGLFEADGDVQDGSTNGARISFSTIHEQLSKEVQELLLYVGIPSKRYKQEHGKGVGHGHIWIIAVPGAFETIFGNTIGFISIRKKQKLDSLINSKSKANPKKGGYPNLRHKIKELGLIGEIRRLLNNISVRGHPVSIPLSQRVMKDYPMIGKRLGLYRITEYGQFLDAVTKVEYIGTRHVFDLTISETHTYISGGFVSHNCDYSQLELRLAAHYSKDPMLMKAYQDGLDLHQMTADKVGATRHVGKTINFLRIYGGSPRKLCDTLEQGGYPRPTEEEAREWLAAYDKAYPVYKQWTRNVVWYARKLGYIKTLDNHRRRLPDLTSRIDTLRMRAERQAVNGVIQGSASSVIKRAMLDIAPLLGGFDAKMLAQVHDELVLEVPLGAAEELAAIVKDKMEDVQGYFSIQTPLVAEPGIGPNWAEAKH